MVSRKYTPGVSNFKVVLDFFVGATAVGMGIAASRLICLNVSQFNDINSWQKVKPNYEKIIQCFISKRRSKCFTDGNGPEVFKKCAYSWVNLNEEKKDWRDGKYINVDGNGACSQRLTPSSHDKLCKLFNDQIQKLRWN